MNNTLSYIIRRTFYVIPIILGVTGIVFLLFNVVLGDPSAILLGKHATIEQMNELRTQLGLDKSLFLQYVDIVKSAFTFEFGRSWSTKQEIWDMITQGAIPSMTLTLPAFLVSTILSITISLLVAFYRGGKIDNVVRISCIALMSISSLAYILFFQWLLAFKLELFEISGYEFGFPNFLPYIILPGIIWIVLTLGPDVRFFRTVMLDEMYQDYVRTGRAKGLTEKVILFRHVLKNAMIPIITYVVIQLPFLILGSLLLEAFFTIPGLGGITLTAINSMDFPVLKAMTVLTAIAYIMFGLLTDILYTIVDPRVRLQ